MISVSMRDMSRGQAVLSALLAVLIGIALWRLAGTFMLHPPLGLGWDFTVLCDAVDVLRRHGNPYLVAKLAHHTFSYPYLPYVAWTVSPVCLISHDGSVVFAVIWLALLAGAAVAVGRGLGCGWAQSVLLGLCALGAFDAGRWAVLTGNAAILEAPLMAGTIIAWERRRSALAGAVLGGLAAAKMLPIVLLLAFPLLLPGRRGFLAVAAGFTVFVPLVAFGVWLAAPFAHDYLGVLTGNIPGQHSPFAENMLGGADPNLPDFLARLTFAAGLLHRGPSITVLALLLLCAGVRLARLRGGGWPGTPLFCLTLLVISLTLFRLKPYAFWSLTLLALGATVEGGQVRPARLAMVMGGLVASVPLIAIPGALGSVFLDYYQLVGLLFATIGLLGFGRIDAPGAVSVPDAVPVYAGDAASNRSMGSQA